VSSADMPPPNLPTPERPHLRRAAWLLVIIMTVLLVLAFVAVVWGFIRQGRILLEGHAAKQVSVGATVPSAADFPLVTLTLKPGTQIVSAQADAGKLVLHVRGPAGDEVQVLNLPMGALMNDVRAPAK